MEIKNKIQFALVALALVMVMAACGDGKKDAPVAEENKEAKAMLQGIWVNEDDGQVMLRVSGDKIEYADSTLQTVTFVVCADTLVINGYREHKYVIVRQTAHAFQFRNDMGDIVSLVKSTDATDAAFFNKDRKVKVHQGETIKRDTIVKAAEKSYHAYMQINPTSYKVVQETYNESGMGAEDVYYDNIINVCVYEGARRLFSRDFHKKDFGKLVPQKFLAQAVLSDILVRKADAEGIEFTAYISLPDNRASYQVVIGITGQGKMTMRLD